jgi:antitoxin component YwqK of YwqJK toxin-antitoxin module
VRVESTWRAGVLDGPWRRHEGGAVVAEMAFANGAREGAFVERWPDGALRREGAFAADQPDGAWIDHRVDGSIAVKARWRRGVPVGTWTWLDAQGGVVRTRTFGEGN